MAKPIVVIAPEKAREELRNSGVLPSEFIKSVDVARLAKRGGGLSESGSAAVSGVHLWPYQMPESLDELSAVEGEFPEFYSYFGVNGNWTKEEKERIASPLIDAVLIHIVFLGAESPDRSYVCFDGFSGIERWSRELKTTLKSRFPNFQSGMEHVLIVVARDGQVRTSKDELERFSKCLGDGDAALFKSCYFLDYNLTLSEPICHSQDVWDIMVGKLLLAFSLKLEQLNGDTRSAPWNVNCGVKAWRTLDCRIFANHERLNAQIRKAAEEAFKRIQKIGGSARGVAGNDDVGFNGVEEDWAAIKDLMPDVLSINDGAANSDDADMGDDVDNKKKSGSNTKKGEEAEGDPLYRDWRDFTKDWDSSSKVDKCVEKTIGNGDMPVASGESQRRWATGFTIVRQGFERFLRRFFKTSTLKSDGKNSEDSKLFESVRKSPDAVFLAETALECKVRASLEEIKRSPGDALYNSWVEISGLESRRRELCERLYREQCDLKLAQSHYVGWGCGIWVAASVAAGCGWLLYRLVDSLGGSFASSLILSVACSAGAFLAYVLVTFLHANKDKGGAMAFAQTSKDIDQTIIDRDKKIRNVVKAGIDRALGMQKMGHRFAALSLLRRVRQILLVEIQPATSVAVNEFIDGEQSDNWVGDNDRKERRRRFLCQIERSVELIPNLETDPKFSKQLNDAIDSWLSKHDEKYMPSDQKTFIELWKELCGEDVNDAGYFPAWKFVIGIRGFFRAYVSSIAALVERAALVSNFDVAINKFHEWLSEITDNERNWDFFSVQCTWKEVNEADVIPELFIDNDEPFIRDEAEINGRLERGGSVWHGTPILRSAFMLKLPTLALVYQECPLKLSCDDKSGVLKMATVPDRK